MNNTLIRKYGGKIFAMASEKNSTRLRKANITQYTNNLVSSSFDRISAAFSLKCIYSNDLLGRKKNLVVIKPN